MILCTFSSISVDSATCISNNNNIENTFICVNNYDKCIWFHRAYREYNPSIGVMILSLRN